MKFQSVSRLDFGVNPNYSAAKFSYAPASHLHARRKLCVNGVKTGCVGLSFWRVVCMIILEAAKFQLGERWGGL